jgi:hypothetical protein
MEDISTQFPGAGGALTGGDAFQVAYYALVSMLVLVGFAYLLSRIMNNRKLEDWAKNEFLQVLISAAMVGGLVALMAPDTGIIMKAFDSLVPNDNNNSLGLVYFNATAANGASSGTFSSHSVFCSASGISTGTALCYAYSYLTLLEWQITGLVSMIFSINVLLDIFSKVAIDIIVVEVTPLSGLSSIVQVLNSIMQSLIFLGILTGVEAALLMFANATALTVFLPLGIVLRCFFATRKVGGTLMAIAVGAYLIFPLAISLNGIAVKQVGSDIIEPFLNVSNQVQGLSIWGNFNSAGDVVTPDKWTAYLAKFNSAAQSLVTAVASLPSMLIMAVSTLVVQVVFLPVISIMITLIAIKELAGLFGGEINLSKFEV